MSKIYLKRVKEYHDTCYGCYYDRKDCHNECNGDGFIVKQIFHKYRIVKNGKDGCLKCCFDEDSKNCDIYGSKYKCFINKTHFELV